MIRMELVRPRGGGGRVQEDRAYLRHRLLLRTARCSVVNLDPVFVVCEVKSEMKLRSRRKRKGRDERWLLVVVLLAVLSCL